MAAKNEVNELNLVGVGTTFEGKIRTSGSLRIDGKVIGEIVATQNIHIGSTGDAEGTIVGKNVTIGGKVNGTITAQEKLVFESKSVIKGDIRAVKLVIDEGALFDGKCVMSEAKPMASVVELKHEMRRADQRIPIVDNFEKPNDEKRQSFTRMFGESGPFLTAGIQLGIGTIGMALLGWWLDDKWNTTPWLMLVGVFFGGGAGLYQFIRSVGKIDNNEKKKEPRQQ